MHTVISKDGTKIAYDVVGSGPVVIWVDGALGHRNYDLDLKIAELLSKHYTVITYDRRGRGDSGDTPPFAVMREIEDIKALIDANGSNAILTGMSSGAVLALKAAAALAPAIEKVVVFEPPFIIDDSRPPIPEEYVSHLNAAMAAGDRSKAVELFMTEALLIPDEYVAGMKADPSWKGMEALAHTLAYDGMIIKDVANGKPLNPDAWASLTMPIAIITGGESEPFFANGAKALTAIVPHGSHKVLAGQNHAVDPTALAPMLIELIAQA